MFEHGDLALAEAQLRVAAGHDLGGDSAVYLAATYHRQHKHELAKTAHYR